MHRFVASTIISLSASLAALLPAAAAQAAPAAPTTPPASNSPVTAPVADVLFKPVFPNANALVTNEYSYWNPNQPGTASSPDWEMTSGSLFTMYGVASTGKIDTGRVDPKSASKTNSAVFRLTTKRADFADVKVGFQMVVSELTSTRTTPAVNWDGVHVFLRYQSQYNLYYASVARRDGKIVIKKKCAGGPSNSGTYYSLSKEIPGYSIPFTHLQTVSADVRNNPDGTVTINLYQNGKVAATATDSGVGCAAITKPGAVGIRGDNARFKFKNFAVTAV